MTYSLTSAQTQVIQTLLSQGSYSAAYQYVADSLDTAVSSGQVHSGVQRWFEFAAQINANSGSWSSNYVRQYTFNAGLASGKIITDAQFQTASDNLAESVLNDILNNNGQIPSTQEIIDYDVDMAVNELGLNNEDWAGSLFSYLFFGYDPNLIFDNVTDPTGAQNFLDAAKVTLNNILSGLGAFMGADNQSGPGGSDGSGGDGRTDTPPGNPGNPGSPGGPGGGGVTLCIFGACLTIPPRDKWPDFFLSPLVLDLDGDGIELFAMGDYGTYFDLNGDGQATITGWVEPDDGLLALDVNGDGVINDITELFGSADTDGFTMLAVHDTNSDGVIDSADSVFSDLLIWTDVNSDGVSQATELHSLADYNIASISVNADRVAQVEIAGNQITHETVYTLNDGTERAIVDAWFQNNTAFTRTVSDYDLDIKAAFLPTLRGWGDIKDLHIAASIDNSSTDPNSLMEQLINLSTGQTFAGVIANWDTFTTDIENLFYRWAGVDTVSPSSRGLFVNAQKLEFYEAFRGFPFEQYGSANPQPNAGQYIEEIFDYLVTFHASHLLTQIAGTEIYTQAYYDLYQAGSNGDLAILQTGIDAVKVEADAATDPLDVWTQFAQYIGYTKGFSNLTAAEITAFDTAVANTGLTWTGIVSAMETSLGVIIDSTDDWDNFAPEKDDTTFGTNAAETLNGDANNNRILGGDGDDIINGLDGADLLEGEQGNDTLNGGLGDDLLLGGLGNDIYVYDSGNDTISEENGGGTDEIRIAASTGITETNITDMFRFEDNLRITFDTGNFIVIDGYANAGGEIEKIVFEVDSSEIDLTALTSEKFYGTEYFDNLVLTGQSFQTLEAYGFESNDTIEVSGAAGELYGGDGYDTLIGGNLDDVLFGENEDDYLIGNAGADTLDGGDGHDVLDGGAGDDLLRGRDGNNTYIYDVGYGNDIVQQDVTSDQNDKVVFGSNILPADLVLIRNDSPSGDDNMIFEIQSTGEQLTVQKLFNKNGAWRNQIDEFEFSDGTVWNHQFLIDKYLADNTTSGDDLTLGFDSDDTFLSSTGNDVLKGYDGNDIYHWGAGSGNDTIYERRSSALNGDGIDRIIFASLLMADLDFSEVSDDLIITNKSTSETLTIDDQLRDSGSVSSFQVEEFEFADGSLMTVLNGFDSADTINATADSDLISGLRGNDIIYAGAGDDLVFGNEGDDTLYGDAGDDKLVGDDGSDSLFGGDGTDTASYENDIGGVTVSIHSSSATDGWGNTDTLNGVENIIGSAFDDLLIGNNGGANAGVNVIRGGDGVDSIQGRNGNDILYGDAGNDLIYGGRDNDIIYGGLGQDVLRGQLGDDTFVLEASTAFDGTFDILKDYSLTDDALDISDIIDYDPLTDVLADFVNVRVQGSNTYVGVDQDGTGGYTDVVRIDGAASSIDELIDFTTGDNLMVV